MAPTVPVAGAQSPLTGSGRTTGATTEQAWPLRPVRLMVGFPPGSSLDTTVRILAPRLAEVWGQPAVIENRSGASGTIATTLTAQATPDGHTALVVTASFTINAVLRGNVGYDPLRDFIGVTQIGFPTSVIAVAPALGVKTLKELIALAHERGGKLLYGSPGAGNSGHLTTEISRIAAGIKGIPVAFKGRSFSHSSQFNLISNLLLHCCSTLLRKY